MVSELKGRKRTRASCRIRVSLESRYGMWNALPGEPQVRAFITFPRAERDLLMVLASSRTFPSAPVFSAFSDPAKSTRSNFPALTLPTVSNVTINSSNLKVSSREIIPFFFSQFLLDCEYVNTVTSTAGHVHFYQMLRFKTIL